VYTIEVYIIVTVDLEFCYGVQQHSFMINETNGMGVQAVFIAL
jgi:hypothetical protein